MKKVRTPELDKLLKARENSQLLGEFLEWLKEENLAICEEDEGNWFPVRRTTEEHLAGYFGINLKKAEQERRALLAAVGGTP